MKSPSLRSGKLFSIVLRVTVYTLKLMGLAPFAVETETSVKNNRSGHYTVVFQFSKTGLAYNVILSVLFPVAGVLIVPFMFSLDYEFASSFTRITDICMGIICTSTAWFLVIYWTLMQRNAVCILNKFSEIYDRLSGLKKRPSANGVLKFIALHVIINACLWITIWVMDFVRPVISNVFANWFIFNLPGFVIYAFILEYSIAVGLLAWELETLNNTLLDFKESSDHLSSLPFLNDYLVLWSSSIHSRLNTLHLLRSIRTTLFELSREIADFFSFPILLCMAYSFLSLISNVYYLLTLAIVQNGVLSLSSASSTIAWIIVTVYPLILLFAGIKNTLAKAKLTGWVVNKLMTMTLKREIKTKLKHFSLQLLHENLKFTAYGFFTLDFTLLHSMFGTMATYIVILIQFK